METVGDATLGGEVNHLLHHIARTCEAETDVARAVKHHIGGLDEIFRTFLHRDSSEESHDFLLARVVGTGNVLQLLCKRINGVVNREALARVLMILVDDGLARQFRHTHDAVGVVHTVFLDGIDRRIHFSTRAVEIRGVNVDAKRFSADLLGVDAGRIGQPVMGMDDVELLGSSHHTCDNRVIVDFLVQIARITACKLHCAEVIDVHIVEIGVDMVAIAEIIVGRHNVADATFDVLTADVAPRDGNGVHRHNLASRLVFVAKGMRQTEHRFDVALRVQTLRNAVVGRCQSAENVRRILPSKH